MKLQSICVFCGSSFGARAEYKNAAQEFGRLLAARNIALVYGGGRIGLMGAMADAALAAGGKAIGVIPKVLYKQEVAHEGLTELRVVESMAERKAAMSELSDAFVALPGGIGTIDELSEVWTWTQLGLQRKVSGLLNVSGYFDSFLEFIERAVSDGFLRPEHRQILLVDTDAKRLLERLIELQSP